MAAEVLGRQRLLEPREIERLVVPRAANRLADAEGLDRAKAAAALADEALATATRFEEERGRRAGINSVPSFVVDGKYLIQGAREPTDYANLLRQVAGLVQNA